MPTLADQSSTLRLVIRPAGLKSRKTAFIRSASVTCSTVMKAIRVLFIAFPSERRHPISASSPCRKRVREARAGTISWTVPDYNSEAVRPRLMRELFLTVSGAESAPITIEPAENRIWEAVAGTKLQIPLKVTRRGEFNETLKLKAAGVSGLDGLKELDVDSKTNAVTLEIDPGQQKLSTGSYTFYLQAQTKGK